MLAAKERHWDVVKMLLEHNASVENRSDDGWTALMFAIAATCPWSFGSVVWARYRDSSVCWYHDEHAMFHLAVQLYGQRRVEDILEETEDTREDHAGAAKSTLSLLLDAHKAQGIGLEAAENEHSLTAFLLACKLGCYDAALALHRHHDSCNVNATDAGGNTALEIAKRANLDAENVSTLVQIVPFGLYTQGWEEVVDWLKWDIAPCHFPAELSESSEEEEDEERDVLSTKLTMAVSGGHTEAKADGLLAILQTPALRDHWVLPPEFSSVRLAAEDDQESSSSKLRNRQQRRLLPLKTGEATWSVKKTFNRNLGAVRLDCAVVTAEQAAVERTAAWQDVEAADELLERVLRTLASSDGARAPISRRRLVRCSEVSRRWHVAVNSDAIWLAAVEADFPLAAQLRLRTVKTIGDLSYVESRIAAGEHPKLTWKQLYAQRVCARHHSSSVVALAPPASSRDSYLIGIEISCAADGRSVFSSLQELSAFDTAGKARELLKIEQPKLTGSTFAATQALNKVRLDELRDAGTEYLGYPLKASVFLHRKCDGNLLALAHDLDLCVSVTMGRSWGDGEDFEATCSDLDVGICRLNSTGFKYEESKRLVKLATMQLIVRWDCTDEHGKHPPPPVMDGCEMANDPSWLPWLRLSEVSFGIPEDTYASSNYEDEYCVESVDELLHVIELPAFARQWV